MKNNQKKGSVLEVLESVGLKIAVVTNISRSERTREVENNLLDMAKSVSRALIESGHEVVLVNADSRMISAIRREKPQLVFNLAERFNGNPDFTPHVAALLEMNSIPFTGADHIIFATCDNKIRAKELMEYYGISTPKFQVFESGDEKLRPDLAFPVIVKPSGTHDSIGINNDSVVYNEKGMRAKIDYILETLKQKVIVEEFIQGREFHVPVLGNENPYALPIAEADLSRTQSGILSYEAKWHINWYKEAPIICPVRLPAHIQNAIKSLAIKTHRKLGLKDYSRVDMRLDRNNIPYVLEVNANPGLTEDCFIFNSAKAAGISYTRLISTIVQIAAERYRIPLTVKAVQ